MKEQNKTEEQKEFCKRLDTHGGDLAEDLMDWARKLKALGYILGTLAWYESKPDSGTEALNWHGEQLGEIIEDYAEFIGTAVEDNIPQINGLEGNAVNQLARCQEVYDFIKDTKRPEDICAIDYRLNELTELIHGICTPAIALKCNFEDLRKRLMAKQEKTAKTGTR